MDNQIPSQNNPNQSINTSQSYQSPVDPQWSNGDSSAKKKKIAVLGGIIVVLVIILGLLVFLAKNHGIQNKSTNSKNIQKGITRKNNIVKKTIDVNTIALQTLNYIKSQKRSDGYNNFIAHIDVLCINKNTCPFGGNNVYPVNNSWSALAFLSGYTIFKDSSYKNLAQADLNKYYEYCNKELNNCLWAITQPEFFYQLTKDPNTLSFLNKAGPSLLKISHPEDLMLLSIESRELTLLYTITHEKKYISEAEKRLDLARKNFIQPLQTEMNSKLVVPSNHICWYTLAAAEYGKESKSAFYLNEAKSAYTNASIRNSFFTTSFAVDVEPCIETYFQIARADNDQIYENYGLYTLDYFVKYFWDTKTHNIVWGENGIAAARSASPSASLDGLSKNVNITDTSYFVYLLSLAKMFQ